MYLFASCKYLQVFLSRYVEIDQVVFDKNTYAILTNRFTDVRAGCLPCPGHARGVLASAIRVGCSPRPGHARGVLASARPCARVLCCRARNGRCSRQVPRRGRPLPAAPAVGSDFRPPIPMVRRIQGQAAMTKLNRLELQATTKIKWVRS